MSRCRSCAAEIRWERTVNGKRIPLDAEPTPDGNIIMEYGVAVVVGNQRVLLSERDDDGSTEFFTSHFATCPDADEHRSKR